MKLLIISEFFPTSSDVDIRGGMELRAFEIARRVIKKYHVTVITSNTSKEHHTHTVEGVHILKAGRIREYVGSGGYIDRLIFMTDAIYKAMNTDFDIIEGSGFFAWLPAFVVSVLRRKKRVLIFADDINQYSLSSSIMVRAVLNLYQRLMLFYKWDKIIAISQNSLLKIIDIARKSSSEVIYCGINSRLINSIKCKKSTNRIICVSRLVKYKRVEDLVNACGRLSDMKIDFELYIVGSGEEEQKLKLLSTKLGITKKVKFLGFIKQHRKVLSLIKSSNIFCLPSIVEGFGIAVIESLAAGVPAVVADLPIHHEVSHGKGTVYFRPGDYIDLTNKLQFLLGRARHRLTLGIQGKQVAARYDWDIISKKIEKVYENLCNH